MNGENSWQPCQQKYHALCFGIIGTEITTQWEEKLNAVFAQC